MAANHSPFSFVVLKEFPGRNFEFLEMPIGFLEIPISSNIDFPTVLSSSKYQKAIKRLAAESP